MRNVIIGIVVLVIVGAGSFLVFTKNQDGSRTIESSSSSTNRNSSSDTDKTTSGSIDLSPIPVLLKNAPLLLVT